MSQNAGRRSTGPRDRSRTALLSGYDLTPYPILAPQATITFVVTRVTASDGTTRASGAIPMARGQLTPAMVAARKPKFTLDTGAGQTERAAYVKGLGRWDDDSYRSMYVELELGATAIPVYVSGNPATRFAGVITFATVRVPADLAKQFHTTARGFSDANGNPPIAWLNTSVGIDQMGKTNAIIASMDANYLSHCGAFGYLGTETDAQALPNGVGASALRHKQRFDTFMVAKHYADAAVGFRSYSIARGAPYNSVATDGGEAWRPGFPHPPSYYNLRQKLGESSPGGGQNSGFAYYDRANAHMVEYARSGELNYLFQGQSMGWAYRWKLRWEYANLNALGNEVGIATMSALYNTQPEQIGMHYLLSGDPESLEAMELLAGKYASDVTHGQANAYNTEPRPLARLLMARTWAWLVSRPANAGYPEGNVAGVNGVESQSWSALLDASVPKVCSGTGFTNKPGGVDLVPAPGWQGYWACTVPEINMAVDHPNASVDAVGVNNFMQPLVMYALIKIFELYSTDPAQKRLILATVQRNCSYLYPGEWEGEPSLNPLNPAANPLQYPAFRNEFTYNGPVKTIPAASSVEMIDVLAVYPTPFAWLGKRVGGVFRSIAERLLFYCVGADSVGWDGVTTPSTGYQKTSAENYHTSLYAWGFVQQAAAALAIPSDVTAQVSLSQVSLALSVGSPAGSVTGKARTAQRFPLSGRAYTGRSTDSAIAGVVVDPVTGVATVTAVGAGSCSVYITADGVDSAPIPVAVTVPQFVDDFSSNTIAPARWNYTQNGANWPASAASGSLVIGGTDPAFSGHGSRVESVNRFSLNVGPLVVRVKARTNGVGCVSIRDNANKGVAVQITANMSIGSYIDPDQSSIDANIAWPGPDTWLRFNRSSTVGNYTVESSTDGSNWTLNRDAAYPVGMDLDHLYVRLLGNQSGAATGSVTYDDVRWA